MSTRPDRQLVTLLSRWLARHAGDDELRSGLDEIGVEGLEPQQREAVEELAAELARPGSRGSLERAARETLAALALG
jgi:hypothetical protein